jgi:hypothetical protein
VLPFEFVVPQNTLESYKEKHASVEYKIEVSADMGWRRERLNNYHLMLLLQMLTMELPSRNKNVDTIPLFLFLVHLSQFGA